MPVPTATKKALEAPDAAPSQVSPRAWAWTSLSTTTCRMPLSSLSASLTSVPAQSRRTSVAETTRPVAVSMTPALPTPRPTTS